MAIINRLERASPLAAARRMATAPTTARDGKDWAGDLVAVARRADRDSFLRIYDHFAPRVCLYLRGMGTPPAIAEELAQEALLKLWQHAAAYDPARSAVSTWLFRIARNLHIDRLRREGPQPGASAEALLPEPGTEWSVTEDYAEHAELQRRIDTLPAVQARLLRMSYFEAKSHQEIAAEVGMPLGTVKSHVRRAFLRLQGQLVEPA
jgi:RNA polymerase sigma-70 factor (ECF subfamily)